MPIPPEDFLRQLQESGILSDEVTKSLDVGDQPDGSLRTTEELAQELVRQKKLTEYQADEARRGNAGSLTLGNYVLMEKIGQGGMGQVFKARHRRMDRFVAIKLLPAELMKDSASVLRFEREVKAAAKISHPNIVAAYDADCAGGVHFLVMELVDGSDLSVLVRKNGPFTVEKAIDCILQAARGLEAAHAAGVVHRDIKPANLLLDNKRTVKILDMGLARLGADSDEAPQSDLTSTGIIMGTVDFMAPEQAMNTRKADARADIYSLGCSLHYLLTGKAMYQGETLMEKLMAHREEQIPSLKAKRPEVPEQLQVVFGRMVAKSFRDRHQTMTEVIADLEACSQIKIQTAVIPVPETSADPDRTKIFDGITLAGAKPNLRTTKPPSNVGRKGALAGVALLGFAVLVIVVWTKPNAPVIPAKTEPSAPIASSQVSEAIPNFDGEPDPAIPTTKLLAFQTPRFHEWMKEIAAMSVEKQLDEVGRMLQELNPGFDGKLTGLNGQEPPIVEDGVVRRLRIDTNHVTDISPVRALTRLRNLDCCGRLSDLSPLAGMSLTDLSFSWSQVADLTPLQGMPLDYLAFQYAAVSDLAPLKGMAINFINCGGTSVSDISPLQGMPLTGLMCFGTKVVDLSPLKEIRLSLLDCSNTKITDLSPLKDAPLEMLNCSRSRISDLSPLRGKNLKVLYCDQTQISDLTPLKGMELTTLTFTPTSITKGIEVVRQMESLRAIGLVGTQVERFSPDAFWKKYDAGEFGRPLPTAKPIADSDFSPEFRQWAREVATMPAEQQVEAVSRKMMELNPGFDGNIEPTIEVNGVVAGLNIKAERVTDISPVRALAGLRRLGCFGTNNNNFTGMSNLSDLSPLKGMALQAIDCRWTLVCDLSPLAEMPLESLICHETPVSDLSPLKGMRLTILNVSTTNVADLSPLKGMPLVQLYFSATQVCDVSALQGMNLAIMSLTPKDISNGLDVIRQMPGVQTIWDGFSQFGPEEFWKKYDAGDCGRPTLVKPIPTPADPDFQQWMTEVTSMSAEQQIEAVGKKLKDLNPGFDGKVIGWDGRPPTIENGVVTMIEFATLNVTDISPVRALVGLKWLSCGARGGSLCDLSPIAGMKLTGLRISGNNVHDLSPLAQMPLEFLDCQMNPIRDISALQGMPLREIDLTGTRIVDISALKGMRLERLSLFNTRVEDLSALQGMPLQRLVVECSRIADLSPLRGMPLSFFNCSQTPVSDLSPLKGMPLKEIHFNNTLVSDLSPLAAMKLRRVFFTPQTNFDGTDALREMKSLDIIGSNLYDPQSQFQPEAFWKRYDAGEFGKHP